MMNHLASIYVDPFKVRNAKLKYRSRESNMKVGETFSEFYTSFLYLASSAKIPLEDYRDDLISKLTINLQEALIARETEYQDYQSLAEYLTGLDQRQRQLREQRKEFHEQYPEKEGPPIGLEYWLECAEKDEEPEFRKGDELPIQA